MIVLVDRPSHFKITDNRNYFTIENVLADDFDNFHTHVRKKKKGKTKTCELLIELICNKVVPDSKYLRTSAKRISRNDKYISQIENKEKKDRSKQHYFNPNKGVR